MYIDDDHTPWYSKPEKVPPHDCVETVTCRHCGKVFHIPRTPRINLENKWNSSKPFPESSYA